MSAIDPFSPAERRPHTDAPFDPAEVRLANRNAGLLLETLRHDVTPVGLHYLLNHFDVPYVPDGEWRVEIGGQVAKAQSITLDDVMQLPRRTLRVTLECAGNGRIAMQPRYQSMPWAYEAVGTADWTGTPLKHVLERAGLLPGVREIAFLGADRGFDRGHEHDYGRSLPCELAMSDDVLLVWAMNGAPLPPQHGFPLRLVVPGWYGMASVKWLRCIEALDRPYDGFQQVRTYMYKNSADAPGIPVTHMRVKSLMLPPGIPDFYTRARMVDAGPTPLFGRAWSGGGVPIARVEVGIDGAWHPAELDPQRDKFAWCGWRFSWQATAGVHELSCRATDADGATQPLQPRWDMGGFGNNVVQRLSVAVR